MVFCCIKLFCVPAFIKITTFCFITIHFKPGECGYVLYFPSLGEFFSLILQTATPPHNPIPAPSTCSVVSNSLPPHGLYVACQALCPWDCPGKNTRVVAIFLSRGILPTRGLNSHLLHCKRIFYQGNPDVKNRHLEHGKKNWEAWHAVVHGVQREGHNLATEQQTVFTQMLPSSGCPSAWALHKPMWTFPKHMMKNHKHLATWKRGAGGGETEPSNN